MRTVSVCSSCAVEKPLSGFWLDGRTGRPRSVCKECATAKKAAHRTEHGRQENLARHRERQKANRHLWPSTNAPATPAQRDRIKETHRERRLERQFGITGADYATMLSSQSGVCAICRKPETSMGNGGVTKALAVDHCHATGRVRGLLCFKCNTVLGKVNEQTDILRRAVDYLESAA